jgi:hypothetical protein
MLSEIHPRPHEIDDCGEEVRSSPLVHSAAAFDSDDTGTSD